MAPESIYHWPSVGSMNVMVLKVVAKFMVVCSSFFFVGLLLRLSLDNLWEHIRSGTKETWLLELLLIRPHWIHVGPERSSPLIVMWSLNCINHDLCHDCFASTTHILCSGITGTSSELGVCQHWWLSRQVRCRHMRCLWVPSFASLCWVCPPQAIASTLLPQRLETAVDEWWHWWCYRTLRLDHSVDT